MRRPAGIIRLLVLCTGLSVQGDAQIVAEPDWAIEARFPGQPKSDGVLMPSPQGDVKVQRHFWEQDSEHYMLARFEYPLAVRAGEELPLYEKSINGLMKSRRCLVKARTNYALGSYEGVKLILGQPREQTIREVRFVVIGAELYLASAEWPEAGPSGAERAENFLESVKVRSEYHDADEVATVARWRELVVGRFRLRYDATRWYRDPADQEPGIFNLLRADQRAEAQFIAEDTPLDGGNIEKAVLDTARESAESIHVRRSGRKAVGPVELVELEFAARVGHVTYINHGYFYSGPEGTVQLRGWSLQKDHRGAEEEINVLLNGLTIVPVTQ